MSQILWIEGDGSAAAELPYHVVGPAEGVSAVEGSHQLDLVAIGTSVTEPVSLAQELRARDSSLEILLVGQAERAEALRRSIRLDPFVGAHTHVVAADADLREKVAEAAESAAQRRRYQEAISSAQSALEEGTSPPRRPSPLHYAAAMWSTSPVGAVAIVRDSRHIISANRAATQLFEQDEIELIGRSLEGLLPGLDGGWDWLSTLDEEDQQDQVVAYERADGEKTHLEVRVAEIDAPAEDVLLLFLWDVSERVRLEHLQAEYLEAERAARVQAERASRIREDVLATVSHDLRGPLQTLLTSVQVLDSLLDDDDEDSPIAQTVATVGRTADYMKKLVGDLLDIARIEGGGLALDFETATARELVERAAELSRGATADKDVTIEVASIDSSLTLNCDPRRVVQLLQNLINNAIKFSPEGETVVVSAKEHNGQVRLSVSDAGPGIASDAVPHLFGRFWQGEGQTEDGAGLGLTIVRGIVDAHNGGISVDSEPGEGATFHVDLPCGPAEEPTSG